MQFNILIYRTYGGEITISLAFKMHSYGSWSKILDSGSGRRVYNVLITSVGTNGTFAFNFYNH